MASTRSNTLLTLYKGWTKFGFVFIYTKILLVSRVCPCSKFVQSLSMSKLCPKFVQFEKLCLLPCRTKSGQTLDVNVQSLSKVCQSDRNRTGSVYYLDNEGTGIVPGQELDWS